MKCYIQSAGKGISNDYSWKPFEPSQEHLKLFSYLGENAPFSLLINKQKRGEEKFDLYIRGFKTPHKDFRERNIRISLLLECIDEKIARQISLLYLKNRQELANICMEFAHYDDTDWRLENGLAQRLTERAALIPVEEIIEEEKIPIHYIPESIIAPLFHYSFSEKEGLKLIVTDTLPLRNQYKEADIALETIYEDIIPQEYPTVVQPDRLMNFMRQHKLLLLCSACFVAGTIIGYSLKKNEKLEQLPPKPSVEINTKKSSQKKSQKQNHETDKNILPDEKSTPIPEALEKNKNE